MSSGPVGFDLDLTLIDSRPQILGSFAALAKETGAVIDLDEISSRMGLKLEAELLYWFEPQAIEGAAAIYRRHYIELARESTEALPGAHAALAAVAAKGIERVIITAKHEMSVGPCLEACGLRADQVFAFVHGPEKAEVLRKIGASLYVGDTPADMAAALSARVVGVGITTGSFDQEALFEAGAEVVLASLENFADWYERFVG